VGKSVAALPADTAALGDRSNCVFMGTLVTQGHGQALITDTGMGTELGRIAGMLHSVKRSPTPLQRRLGRFGRRLALAALALVGLVFAVGVAFGGDPRVVLLTAMSLAVAAVPEGLPAVATVCLALGGRRLLAREALIRKLPAVESLGSVTVICSDKTGTLTQNRMTVTVLDVAGERLELVRGAAPPPDRCWPVLCDEHRSQALMLIAGTLCNDAVLSGEEEAVGDPTEAAFVLAAHRLGLSKPQLEKESPRVDEVSFDSDRRRMTTLHRVSGGSVAARAFGLEAGGLVALGKGGIGAVLDACTQAWTGERSEPLDEALRARILTAHEDLAGQGMRVLGFAYRTLNADAADHDELERDLVFIGMMGLRDPPRPQVCEAVARCLGAGIRPVMITGDHPLTAGVIAAELGIDTAAGVASGAQLAAASDAELEVLCRTVSVFARVAPEQKLRIVEALQAQGEAVAMTGDGVNDAPALKKADIGVAMGITGTDVSKEAADMVLLDDDFTSIVNAVEEGRVIHDNVGKFIKYTLASNAGEIWVMLLGPFLGMPLALLPLQVLWVNLVTDGLPGLALSVEPGERGLMSRPPRRRSESFLAGGLIGYVGWVSVLMGVVALGTGWAYWRAGASTEHWRTMVFTVLTLSQLGHAMSVRSARDTLARVGLFSNPLLLGSVLLTFGLQLGLIYWEPLRRLFHLTSLSAADLGIAVAASTIVFLGTEGAKVLARRRAGD
jgi:Ca2+-transporting ATPase